MHSNVANSRLFRRSSISSSVVICRTCTGRRYSREIFSNLWVALKALSSSRQRGWLEGSPARTSLRRASNLSSSSAWTAILRLPLERTRCRSFSSWTRRLPVLFPMNILTPGQPGRRSSSASCSALSGVAPTNRPRSHQILPSARSHFFS